MESERKIKFYISPQVKPGSWTLGEQHPIHEDSVVPLYEGVDYLADHFLTLGIVKAYFRKNPQGTLFMLINQDDYEQGVWA